MQIQCKIQSSYSQIMFGATKSSNYVNPWDSEGALDNGVGYAEYIIAVSCQDWRPEPNIIVKIQDFAPKESYIHKGTYQIASENRYFQLGTPDEAGAGITFQASKETLTVEVYIDDDEAATDILLFIDDSEFFVVPEYYSRFEEE